MEAVEQGIYSLRGASQIFHIPLSSFSDHLNGHSRSKKMGPPRVLMEEEDVVVYNWTLAMRECGLLISLN
jgi:hypothetical protein